MFAAFSTGVIGASTFYAKGGGSESVDIPAALAITGSAVLTTRIAAKYAQNIAGHKLLMALGGMMTLMPPLVWVKPYLGALVEMLVSS